MNKKDIEFYLNIAKLAAERSNSRRLKVGGVICDSLGNLVATGYNGNIRDGSNNLEHCDETGLLVTNEDVIHAEMNLIAHAARRGVSVNNGSVYLTHSPCLHCTAMLIQSGIQEVVFLNKFRTYDEVKEKYSSFIKIISYF